MSNQEIKSIPLIALQPGRFQPRQEFDQNALNELAISIKSSGIIHPLIIRPINVHHYEIIAGERRYRAAQLAGLTEVPCIIRLYSDQEAAKVALIENLQRSDLNPIESAYAYQRLITEFHLSHDDIAAMVGKSRSTISNVLRLLKLPEEIQQLLISGILTEGHVRVLITLPLEQQISLANQVAKQQWSVRKLEAIASKATNFLKKENHATQSAPEIKKLENDLSGFIGCPVNIEYHNGKGSLKIDFFDLEILEGVLRKIGFVWEE